MFQEVQFGEGCLNKIHNLLLCLLFLESLVSVLKYCQSVVLVSIDTFYSLPFDYANYKIFAFLFLRLENISGFPDKF